MSKASKVGHIINYFNSQESLYPKNDPWYVETERKEIELIKNDLLMTDRNLKFLFGGHPGNGKSTELNKINDDKAINEKYLLVKYSANEVLDINDVDIVDLLLTIALKILEKTDTKLSSYLQRRLKEMEGYFTDTLQIEKITTEAREGEIEVGVDAKTDFRFPFVKLGTGFFARMRFQSDTRKQIREKYRPKITELQDLINDIILDVKKSFKLPLFNILLIIDDLDKIQPKEAEKIFFEQGNIIGKIQCSVLLTIPISMIYSPKNKVIANQIGGLQKVLRNLRLKDINGKEDEVTKKNRDILSQLVFNRMEDNLIEDNALNMAIEASGGVFRTLIDIIASASSYSNIHGGTKIDSIDMEAAINEERANKKRALDRTYYDILLDIYDHKRLLTTDRERIEVLELFHSLFALEYMNGKEWCDIHPLLIEEVEAYRKIKQNEKV